MNEFNVTDIVKKHVEEMIMSYKQMIGLACFVATKDAAEYDRETIDIMVTQWGWETVDDFYEMYGRMFSINVDEIREWIDEMAQEAD